ncbi:MAG: 2Fe-2S iron-sulfur cluster-binding protein [Gammaproteobacteria bacterium]|nr:2Fe-2S iron-sulfur cluster-binding protein [Gammaproteobacteria bacterium]MDH5800768.1 2Fe-2S iron-sulfur cluster-binding protein [Gammaproteobacteria bacterium]
MSGHQVKLLPAGREFTAFDKETLLDAGLRAGLNMNYSCAGGSCGECKARVVQGSCEPLQHFDYVFSDAEKSQNMVLMCCMAAAEDLVLEASTARTSADIPQQNVKAKVANIEVLDEQHRVLHLRTPRSSTLRFLAGQYVQLQFQGLPPKDIAIASCPCNGMVLQFHVRQDGSDFSEAVFSRLKSSDHVTVTGPCGEFALDEESRRPLVMVAQDTGFGPIKSLVEHAIALELEQSMTLFWVVEQGQKPYLENYCRSWLNALDNFVFFVLEWDSTAGDSQLRALTQEIVARSPVETEIDLYVAAKPSLTQAADQAFRAKGTPPSRVMLTSIY